LGAWLCDARKGYGAAFLITEITFSILFVVLSWLLVGKFGLVGVSMAYAINYCFYWVGMGYLVRQEMRQMEIENR